MMNEKRDCERDCERFFFWFDTEGKLMKIYDRKYKKDYFRSDEELFDIIFDVVISQLENAVLITEVLRRLDANEPELAARAKRVLEAR